MRTAQIVGLAVLVVLVAVVAYFLGSMQVGQQAVATPTASPSPTTTAVKKISFYTWWAGLERFAIDAVIGNFTKKTGIQVRDA